MKKIAEIKVPGKLILMGEYSVLEGAPSVVAAINRYVRIDIYKMAEPFFEIYSKNFEQSIVYENLENINEKVPDHAMLFLHKIISLFFNPSDKRINRLKGFRFVLDSSDFYWDKNKLGFGSSAAVLVGVILGLYRLTGVDGDEEDLFFKARDIHYHLQQKSGSGIDIAASTFGGVLQYRIPEAFANKAFYSRLSVKIPPFTIVWSGKSVKTSPMVKKVEKFKEKQPAAFAALMYEMNLCTDYFLKSLLSGDWKVALSYVDEYYKLLRQLGRHSGADIISDEHAEIYEIVKSSGGYYKPSGAGGGDIGLILAVNENHMSQIKEKLRMHQIQMIECSISRKGAVYEECN